MGMCWVVLVISGVSFGRRLCTALNKVRAGEEVNIR